MQTEHLDAPPPPSIVDRRGQRHHRLTVVGFAGRDRHGNAMWHCRCDCGGMSVARINHLTSGGVQSCGCMPGGRPRMELLGMELPGGDRVVAVEDDRVTVACAQGHAWDADRVATLRRRIEARGTRRAHSQCPVCQVGGTIDLRGQTVGLLTVLDRAGTDAPDDGRFRGQATWRVRCVCGAEKVVRGAHLRRDEDSVRTCGARACIARWQSARGASPRAGRTA